MKRFREQCMIGVIDRGDPRPGGRPVADVFFEVEDAVSAIERGDLHSVEDHPLVGPFIPYVRQPSSLAQEQPD